MDLRRGERPGEGEQIEQLGKTEVRKEDLLEMENLNNKAKSFEVEKDELVRNGAQLENKKETI